MRIPCPFCGPRDVVEFSYFGDADASRPDTSSLADDHGDAMHNHVYLRNNPAGLLNEYWYHGAGCHSWIVVRRDTRTHLILGAAMAGDEVVP